MLANDARILIRSAVATAIVGVILVVVGAIIDGGKGALGAVFGVTLVAVFFSLSVVAVSLAGRWGSAAMTATALGTYVVKILAVLIIVAGLQNTTVFNTKLFGVTAIICILAWSAGQVATLARRRMLYVVPEVRQVSTVPEVRQVSTVPEVRQVSVVPEVRQVSVVPEVRDAGTEPEVREAGTEPEVRGAGTEPEVREAGTPPDVSEADAAPRANGVSVAPGVPDVSVAREAREVSTVPNERQSGGER